MLCIISILLIIISRCKDLVALRFLESFQIRALNNGFPCDSTIGSGEEEEGEGEQEQERSPKSLDSFDTTRFYSSFDTFIGDQIHSQGSYVYTKPMTTFKRAQRRHEITTDSAKGRHDPDYFSRVFTDALERDSTSCDRLIAILIALDFVVVIRRMFRLYEKFRSFQRYVNAPPASKENAAYSSCDLGRRENQGQSYPMTTDLNHTGNDEVFRSISSKLGPDEPLDEETVLFDDATAYRTRCDSMIFDGKTENGVENVDTNSSNNFLEVLFSGFIHESVIPELVMTAFVIALLVTGMTVLSRRSDIFQVDDRFWTSMIYLWKSWTNDTEEISQTMKLEGNIRSELVYLDATIAHLCSGNFAAHR